MERIEHASDYLQQTNIHVQLELERPWTPTTEQVLFKLGMIQFDLHFSGSC